MTDHPLSIDISFLLPPDGGWGEANSPRGTAGDEMRHMGRVAGSALSQSNVVRGTFPASVNVISKSQEGCQFGQERFADESPLGGAEVIRFGPGGVRRHG